jgi:hypothetical protein
LPGGGGVSGQIHPNKALFHIFIVWLKQILPDKFIWFQMRRTIFLLHFNQYFFRVGHCPGGWGHLKNEDLEHFLGPASTFI